MKKRLGNNNSMLRKQKGKRLTTKMLRMMIHPFIFWSKHTHTIFLGTNTKQKPDPFKKLSLIFVCVCMYVCVYMCGCGCTYVSCMLYVFL